MEKNKFRKKSNSDTSSLNQGEVDSQNEISTNQTVSIKMEEVMKFRSQSKNEKKYSSFGIKSPTSFLLGMEGYGLQLLENEQEIFSGELPSPQAAQSILVDIIYVDHLDCYLIYQDEKIYRKDINSQPCYFLMNAKISFRKGVSLRYSRQNRRLIVTKDSKHISVIDLDRKRFEMILEESLGYINDYRVFGENENKIISLTVDGYIGLHILSYSLKKVCFRTQVKVELKDHILECATSIAVSKKNDYAIVGLDSNDFGACFSSRMIIYKIEENRLSIRATLDRLAERMRDISALDCCGYFAGHLLWIGLSLDLNGIVHIFDYDVSERELKEQKELRVSHKEIDPLMIRPIQNSLYYCGRRGILMKLTVKI